MVVGQLAASQEAAEAAERRVVEREAELRLAKQQSAQQLAAAVSERDALSRRLRALQKTLEEERSKVDSSAAAQSEAIQVAVAARVAQLQELKTTDKRIISEVRWLPCLSAVLLWSLQPLEF